MNSKFERELKELLENNIISPEVSQRIQAYYQKKYENKPNRLFAIFGVLGSLLVGLGIILILAHNWDNFSRSVKTVWAFLPLIIGQGLVVFSILKQKSTTWKEASGTFLFFAVGASISLVSQIYNIPGNLASFLLAWTLLCAPLMYLLKSKSASLLHLLFSTYYACTLGYFDSNKTPWLYLLLLLILMPQYLKLIRNEENGNFTSIMHWLIPLSITITLGAFLSGHDSFGFLLYVALFGFCYNLGKLPLFDGKKLRSNGYLIIGSLGTVFVLMINSFRWFWKDIPDGFNFALQDIAIAASFIAASLWIIGYLYRKQHLKEFNLFQYTFLIFAVIFFTKTGGDTLPMVLTNLLILTLALFAIRIGTKKNHYGVLNYGLLIITILVICRFFDTNIDFVARGLVFLFLGAGFFATNYLMYKRQSKLSNQTETEQ